MEERRHAQAGHSCSTPREDGPGGGWEDVEGMSIPVGAVVGVVVMVGMSRCSTHGAMSQG